MNTLIIVAAILISLAIGIPVGMVIRKKIAESKDIDSYVKRINSVADLLDHEIIETPETLANQSPERAKNFKNTVMLTGVNDSTRILFP